MRKMFGVLTIVALTIAFGEVFMSQASAVSGVKNVVLVHGGPRPGGLAPRDTRTRFSWSLEL